MRIFKSVLLVFSLLSTNLLIAEPADDPNTFQVETTTMKMNPGKDLEDLLAIRSKFATFAKSGDLKFGSVVLVPWAVSKAAFPDAQDWDVLWVGYSPNTADYAGALSYYLENGAMINADFDSVRTNVGTTLMGAEAVFRSGAERSDAPGVVLFRTCQLNAKQSMDNAKKAMVAMSEKLQEGGSKGSTFFWNPGPGAAPSMEDSFIISRWFPSVEAWGQSAMAYQNGDLSKEQAAADRAMECSAFRMYTSYSFYNFR